MVTSEVGKEILSLESQRIEAMVKRDLDTLDRLLAYDLSYTHSGGRTDDKASFLALIEDTASSYVGVDYSEIEVIPCGDAAVTVRGRAQIRLERQTGERPSYPVRFSVVYAFRDGAWSLVLWHATRIPD